jgi:hypothetical protein
VRAEEAILAGVDFLRARQSAQGCWTDWDLPPGRSSMWTTAYVGCELADLAPQSRAAQWLAEHELTGGGWGYDESVGCDADSSAHAVILLRRSGNPVDDRSRRRLESFQQSDGGFSTYGRDDGLGSWSVSHPDVTPVAGYALLLVCGRGARAVTGAVESVRRHRNGNGLWDSFWWSTPLYATRASLAFLAVADISPIDVAATRTSLLQLEARSAFERALLLDCLRLVGGDQSDGQDELLAALLSEQQPDGSWPSAPSLRIPDRSCTAPWDEPGTEVLYADCERLFTSATVVGALGRAAPASSRLVRGQLLPRSCASLSPSG